MKAVIFEKYGSADVLTRREVPKPSLSDDELLIRIHCTSVNPIDWKIRNGSLRLFMRIQFPKILGFDVAGVVIDTGSSVKKFKKDDRVFCMLDFRSNGAYAEYVTVKENIVAKIPDRLDFQEAAAVPLAGLTAFQALHDKGRIRGNDAVLIHGASGGVGSFAVQIARDAGAKVTGICSTRNVEIVKKLGAHEVIDYTRNNLRLLSGSYDIIFDAVGMLQYFRIKKNLKSTGRYITTLPNQFSNVASFFLTILAAPFGLKKKSAFITVKSSASNLESLTELLEDGKIVPLIDRTYTLEEIQKAHQYSESGRAQGKIVIKIYNHNK